MYAARVWILVPLSDCELRQKSTYGVGHFGMRKLDVLMEALYHFCPISSGNRAFISGWSPVRSSIPVSWASKIWIVSTYFIDIS